MARLIVGVATSTIRESPARAAPGGEFTLDVGDGQMIELAPQHLESDGTSWYWVDVDDDDATNALEALSSTPGVVSSYVQAPDGLP